MAPRSQATRRRADRDGRAQAAPHRWRDTGGLNEIQIQMNDFERQWVDVRDDALRVFEAVGRSGWYILGPSVREFEVALGAYWGLREVVGVGSGLDAIEIALRAAGMQPGDRVLTTALSAFATTLAIVRSGGIPVFCDTTETGLIDFEEARAALRAMPGIRYFVPVHLYGFPLDASALGALINEFNLICIEDCAQSIGAVSRGKATGRAGLAAATSFYPTKNLGAMGDGGAVLTADAGLAAKMRSLRDYGQSAKYRHTDIGGNSRLDELQAALLKEVFLPRLSGWNERRRQIAERYLNGWRFTRVRPVWSEARLSGEWRPSWHLFPARVTTEEKASLLHWLRGRGIVAGEHYPILIPDQEAMAGVNSVCFGALNHARSLAASEISLPIHPYMTNAEADTVLAAIGQWENAVGRK
jgi:dTDP-4-amino-4,6-dideoxygalactose transaminase